MLGSLLRSYHISRPRLAHQLGVSVQTIHNWCSGRVLIPSVRLEPLCELLEHMGVPSDELAQLVVRQLESHGIHSDRLALKPRGVQPTVMIMTWDLTNPGLFGPITKVARASLEGLGYQCMVVDCGGEHRIRRAYVHQAVTVGVAGLLLCGVPGETPNPDDDLFSSLKPSIAAGIPIVFLKPWTGSVSLPAGVGSIGWDSIAAVEQAVGLLVSHGHTRIRALLADSGANLGGRYRGLDQVWQNLGLTFDEDECIAWSPRGGLTNELRESLRSSTAIFTPPSNLLMLARACFEADARWPDDISITSLGNREFVPQLSRRPFTFVNIPIGRVSRGAAQLLSSMIKGERFQTGQEYVVYGASTMSVENLENGSVGPPGKRESFAAPTPSAASHAIETPPATMR